MYEIQPSDRVQIRQRNELLAPACCAICGNGTCLDGFIDPGIFYEWEGQVYFCMNCAKEIARAVGSLTPEESRYLEGLNEKMAQELAETREKFNDFRAIADLIERLTGTNAASLSISLSEDATAVAASVTAPADGSETRKPVAKKSVASSRSNDAAQPPVRNTGKSFAI